MGNILLTCVYNVYYIIILVCKYVKILGGAFWTKKNYGGRIFRHFFFFSFFHHFLRPLELAPGAACPPPLPPLDKRH